MSELGGAQIWLLGCILFYSYAREADIQKKRQWTMHPSLESFVNGARAIVAQHDDAAERVDAIAPLMLELLGSDKGFLGPEHFRSTPEHHARNAIYICPTGSLSLFALVWLPGQWTPVHDHGSWGVVGGGERDASGAGVYARRRRHRCGYGHKAAARRRCAAQPRG